MESIKICNVCYIDYDVKEHAPRCLPCGHTLCSACLTGILDRPNLRKCSFDNLAFTPSQTSLSSFPLNFAIMDVLEQKNSNTCKIHPGKTLKYLCLTDKAKVCSECTTHESHKKHEIKKIKELKAQGVKVKKELQETLGEVKDYEQKKADDFEQIKKVFIKTLDQQFKEIKEVLIEKQFEWVQLVTNIFNEDKKNDTEAISAFKQQIDETIKDITHACQDENGDLMILDKEAKNSDQKVAKKRTQFLQEKSSRVRDKVIELQESLKEALVSSQATISSLQLSTQDIAKEIYSMQEEKDQLSQEELMERHKKLRCIKFMTYFDLTETPKCLEISTTEIQPKHFEINLDDFQAIRGVNIALSRYDTLMKEPNPSILSYILNGIRRLVDLTVSFSSSGFDNECLLWFGNTIRNHVDTLKGIFLDFGNCKFEDDSMSILCDILFSKAVRLQSLNLNLDSCLITDTHLKILIKSLQPISKKLKLFAIRLKNNKLTNSGVSEVLKLIQSMEALKELYLDLSGLKMIDESFRILGETILPKLETFHSLTLLLNDSPISDERIYLILKNVPSMKRLHINLNKTLLTDRTVEMFIDKMLPRLEELEYFYFTAEETKISKKNQECIQCLRIILEQ